MKDFFSGPMDRKRYLLFIILLFIISYVFSLVLDDKTDHLGIVFIIFSLLSLRRITDIGISRWWFLVVLIPFITSGVLYIHVFHPGLYLIPLLYLIIKPSKEGSITKDI